MGYNATFHRSFENGRRYGRQMADHGAPFTTVRNVSGSEDVEAFKAGHAVGFHQRRDEMTSRSDSLRHWWQDNGEIARLLRWLWEEDDLDMANAIDLVAKPWNWDNEFQEMCRAQATRSGEREDARLAKAEDGVHMADDYYTCGG